jgi:hypothetical protein
VAGHSPARRNRRELAITDTELKVPLFVAASFLIQPWMHHNATLQESFRR